MTREPAITPGVSHVELTEERLGGTPKRTLGLAILSIQTIRRFEKWLLDNAKESRDVAGAAGVNYLMLLGYVCGGWVMGLSALKAAQLLGTGGGDEAFLQAKLATAQFYCDHLLPRAGACLVSVKAGPGSTMALSEDQF